MKWYVISLSLFLLFAHAAMADGSYPPIVDEEVGQVKGNRFVPRLIVVQNAGNMGLLSAGVGWDYGRRGQWETLLMLGFIPKSDGEKAKPTLTLKQNFIPWSKPIADKWSVDPLTCSCYISTVMSHEFWGRPHSSYGNSYYWLTNRFTVNVALGQRITRQFTPKQGFFFRSVTAFYEVSTCNFALIDCLSNKTVSLWEVLGLSIGVRLQVR